MSAHELTEAEVALLSDAEYEAIIEAEQDAAEHWARLRVAWWLSPADIEADQAAARKCNA